MAQAELQGKKRLNVILNNYLVLPLTNTNVFVKCKPGGSTNVPRAVLPNVFVKCKPGGSTQRSTVLPKRAGVDADVKAGALRRPVKLPPGCPGRRYTRHVAIETANPRRWTLFA